MPRTPPGERWGGRSKGTPNKRTAEAAAIFAKKGFDCIEKSIELYTEWEERARKGPLEQRREYQEMMSSLLGRLSQYQHPRLRSVDVKVEDLTKDKYDTPEKRRAKIAELQTQLGYELATSNGMNGTHEAPE